MAAHTATADASARTAGSSDPIAIMIASDAWGTRIVLNACRGLTREQFHREFPMGLGSLHMTLTHILSAMRRWTDRLAGRTPRPMLHAVSKYPHLTGDFKDRTVDELLGLLDEAEKDLKKVAADVRGKLDTTVSLDWPDGDVIKTYTFTRAAVFTHICTHGSHHRAQCLNMLRHLNVPGVSDKLPEPAVTDWQAEAELPPTTRPAAKSK